MTQLEVFWLGVVCMVAIFVVWALASAVWLMVRKPRPTLTPTEIIGKALHNSAELQRRTLEHNAVFHKMQGRK